MKKEYGKFSNIPDQGGRFSFLEDNHIIDGWHYFHKIYDQKNWTAGMSSGVESLNQATAGDLINLRSCDFKKT